ncbi:MAG: glucose-6-phosphate isomerase [Spirochaetia bacterium]|nr:glucose-6-phosphate isomerase [Spirochaetia bacterium]
MFSLTYRDLDDTAAFDALKDFSHSKPGIADLLTPETVRCYTMAAGEHLMFSYAAKGMTPEFVSLLQDLADECHCTDRYRELLGGAAMNTGENRAVMHHLCRGSEGLPLCVVSAEHAGFYASQRDKFLKFAEQIRSGAIKSPSGHVYDTVVQIGVGGSCLGPKTVYEALDGYVGTDGNSKRLKVFFLSNVDPDECADIFSRINAASTIFIFVSKSGTTQETVTNFSFMKKLFSDMYQGQCLEAQTVAVTDRNVSLPDRDKYLASFYIDSEIGGRFSVTSACGGVMLSIAFGAGIFSRFLAGAHCSDVLALNDDIRKNAALMDALLGIYDVNILGYKANAVIPYSRALCGFHYHIQQLFMESNGKQTDIYGRRVRYETCPVTFGAVGTDCQHSFFQQFHQGTSYVPLEFIGFSEGQMGQDFLSGGHTSQHRLNACLAAQITALAVGRSNADPGRAFDGGRGSVLLFGDRLTPENMGALIAHFENKAMFQGFLWNVNSFDQEGVKLGKELAGLALSDSGNDVLRAYYSFF